MTENAEKAILTATCYPHKMNVTRKLTAFQF